MNLVEDVVGTIQTKLEEAIADAKDRLVEEAAERIKERMEGQPYKAECAVCGDVVNVTSEVDSDGDLLISVKAKFIYLCKVHKYKNSCGANAWTEK